MYAIPNDLVRLRLFPREGESAKIEVQDLFNLSQVLQHPVYATASALGLEAKDQKLFLVAPPRQGCIEFLFQPHMELVLSSASFEGQSWSAIFSDIGGTVMALWTVVYGGRGIVDLWRDRKGMASPAPRSTEGSQIIARLARHAIDSPIVVTAVRRLVQDFSERGFVKIEIEVLDSPTVVLFEAEKPLDIPQLGDRPDHTFPQAVIPKGFIEFTREGDDKILVKMDGNLFQAVSVTFQQQLDMRHASASSLGQTFPQTIMLLFREDQELPTSGDTFYASGEEVSLRDLHVVDGEVPDTLRRIRAAFRVTKLLVEQR